MGEEVRVKKNQYLVVLKDKFGFLYKGTYYNKEQAIRRGRDLGEEYRVHPLWVGVYNEQFKLIWEAKWYE